MVLSLRTIFDLIEKDKTSDNFEVTCSYLEVYNEVIYDLLEKSSGHLELREDPEQGIIVVDLRSIKEAIKFVEMIYDKHRWSLLLLLNVTDLRIVTSFESE
ncbi:kinesin-like protein KIN-8B isoform X3 [Henckelia pumila]|uniref:kinesin-like protein KIN-8B isoform X3 n=1 Tax=Henckelia pumila TaxID=405737 RepID=UPI003C6E7422